MSFVVILIDLIVFLFCLGILPLDSAYSGCGELCIFNEYDLGKLIQTNKS